MQTLIFNGSPRKNGDTTALVSVLCQSLEGEIKIISPYFDNIKPCVDCRHCWKEFDCVIKDEMQEIYTFLEKCDNVVIASPIYFSGLTGPLLSLFSRLQIYFSAKYIRHEEIFPKQKRGAIILTAGGSGGQEKAKDTAKHILDLINAEYVGTSMSLKTDTIPAKNDISALEDVNNIRNEFMKSFFFKS